MKRNWKKAMASLLVLLLIATLSFGCGGEDEGKVVITVGELTDLTGPGSPAVITIHYVIEDIARYYNEKNLIPGVKIKVASYDTKFDPAREVAGYEWLKSRGAEVVICLFPGTGEVLKPFAERDKVVIATCGMTLPQLDPPAWNFGFSCTQPWAMKTIMGWISNEQWDYSEGIIPKIGFAAWSEPGGINVDRAMREYIEDNPGSFDYVGSFFAPVGAVSWSTEVEKVKGCDFVNTYGFPMGNIMKEFQTKGYSATFIDAIGMGAYTGYLVDMLGWEALDGNLTANTSILWDESTPIVDLVYELLDRYRAEQAEDIIYAGLGYVGAAHQVMGMFEVLQQAVERVGAKNFDGQAYYDAAINYKTTSPLWEGYPEWSFGETKRYLIDHIVVDEFQADVQDLVRVSEWLPLVK